MTPSRSLRYTADPPSANSSRAMHKTRMALERDTISPWDKSDRQMIREGGWSSKRNFMDSHGLRIYKPEDFDEAKELLDHYRRIDAQQSIENSPPRRRRAAKSRGALEYYECDEDCIHNAGDDGWIGSQRSDDAYDRPRNDSKFDGAGGDRVDQARQRHGSDLMPHEHKNSHPRDFGFQPPQHEVVRSYRDDGFAGRECTDHDRWAKISSNSGSGRGMGGVHFDDEEEPGRRYKTTRTYYDDAIGLDHAHDTSSRRATRSSDHYEGFSGPAPRKNREKFYDDDMDSNHAHEAPSQKTTRRNQHYAGFSEPVPRNNDDEYHDDTLHSNHTLSASPPKGTRSREHYAGFSEPIPRNNRDEYYDDSRVSRHTYSRSSEVAARRNEHHGGFSEPQRHHDRENYRDDGIYSRYASGGSSKDATRRREYHAGFSEPQRRHRREEYYEDDQADFSGPEDGRCGRGYFEYYEYHGGHFDDAHPDYFGSEQEDYIDDEYDDY